MFNPVGVLVRKFGSGVQVVEVADGHHRVDVARTPLLLEDIISWLDLERSKVHPNAPIGIATGSGRERVGEVISHLYKTWPITMRLCANFPILMNSGEAAQAALDCLKGTHVGLWGKEALRIQKEIDLVTLLTTTHDSRDKVEPLVKYLADKWPNTLIETMGNYHALCSKTGKWDFLQSTLTASVGSVPFKNVLKTFPPLVDQVCAFEFTAGDIVKMVRHFKTTNPMAIGTALNGDDFTAFVCRNVGGLYIEQLVAHLNETYPQYIDKVRPPIAEKPLQSLAVQIYELTLEGSNAVDKPEIIAAIDALKKYWPISYRAQIMSFKEQCNGDGVYATEMVRYVLSQWPKTLCGHLARDSNTLKAFVSDVSIESLRSLVQGIMETSPLLAKHYAQKPFSELAKTATPLEVRAAVDACLEKHPAFGDELNRRLSSPALNYGWALGKLNGQERNVYHRVYNPLAKLWETVRVSYDTDNKPVCGYIKRTIDETIERFSRNEKVLQNSTFEVVDTSLAHWTPYLPTDAPTVPDVTRSTMVADWYLCERDGLRLMYVAVPHPVTLEKRRARITVTQNTTAEQSARLDIFDKDTEIVPKDQERYIIAAGKMPNHLTPNGERRLDMVTWTYEQRNLRAFCATPNLLNPLDGQVRPWMFSFNVRDTAGIRNNATWSTVNESIHELFADRANLRGLDPQKVAGYWPGNGSASVDANSMKTTHYS